MKYIYFVPILLILLTCGLKSEAQVVYENPNHPVYQFLARQAQKGKINFDDLIQPISRKEISTLLHFLQDSVTTLSSTEKKRNNLLPWGV